MVALLCQLFQGVGSRFGCIHLKAIFSQPILKGIPNDKFIVYHQDAELLACLPAEVNGVRGTDLFALAAQGAGNQIDSVGIWYVMGHRQVDRLSFCQPGIELVSHLNWADTRALPTTCTAFWIHYGWLLP